LSKVVFTRFPKPDGSVVYKSSDPSRKIAELEPGSPEPDAGRAYAVEIIQDTNPSDATKGKLVVRILHVDLDVPLAIKRKEAKPAIPENITAVQDSADGGHVLILETELPINAEGGPLVPRSEDFRHFALDARTVMTLEKIAAAVELRQPCLLEGETATSKTSAIEYLAMRTNTPKVRLNLNGQTDTSELIGKYVPNDGQLAIELEQALRDHGEKLDVALKTRLEKARKEGRTLTMVESQELAHALGLEIPEWRWKDGYVPMAMKKGYWLILDEINLSEPQILERLNSLLERHPSLNVSEHEGEVIGPGGAQEVHERFRIFATENPASYAGRKAMSPAFKNRWSAYQYVDVPSESDYAAMMNLMVYGEQPTVKVRNMEYASENVEPLFDVTGKVEGMRGFFPKLAKFHAKLEQMARSREIGKGREEPYVFTRRDLTIFLGFLEEKSFTERRTGKRFNVTDEPKAMILRALQHAYLDKITNEDDRKKVNDVLDLIGISEKKWLHAFPASEKPKAPERRIGDVFLNASIKGESADNLGIDLGNVDHTMAVMDKRAVLESVSMGQRYPVRISAIGPDGKIFVVPYKEKKTEHEPGARMKSRIIPPEEPAAISLPIKPEDIKVGEVFENAKIAGLSGDYATIDLGVGVFADTSLELLKRENPSLDGLITMSGLFKKGDHVRARVVDTAGSTKVYIEHKTESSRVPLKKEDIQVGDIFANVKVVEVNRAYAKVELEPGGVQAGILLGPSMGGDMEKLLQVGDTIARLRISENSGPSVIATMEKIEDELTPRKSEDIKIGEVFRDAKIIHIETDMLTLDADGLDMYLSLSDYNASPPPGRSEIGGFIGIYLLGDKFPGAVRVQSVFGDMVYCEPIKETPPRKKEDIEVGEVFENAEVVGFRGNVMLIDLGGGVRAETTLEIAKKENPSLAKLKTLVGLFETGNIVRARVVDTKSGIKVYVEHKIEKPPLKKEEINVGDVFANAKVVDVTRSYAVVELEPGGKKATIRFNPSTMKARGMQEVLQEGDVITAVRIAENSEFNIIATMEMLEEEVAPRKPEDIKVGEVFEYAEVENISGDRRMAAIDLGGGVTAEATLRGIYRKGDQVKARVIAIHHGEIMVEIEHQTETTDFEPEDIEVGQVFEHAKIKAVTPTEAEVELEPGIQASMFLFELNKDPKYNDLLSLGDILSRGMEAEVRVIVNNRGTLSVVFRDTEGPGLPAAVEPKTLGKLIKEKLAENAGKEIKLGDEIKEAKVVDMTGETVVFDLGSGKTGLMGMRDFMSSKLDKRKAEHIRITSLREVFAIGGRSSIRIAGYGKRPNEFRVVTIDES